MKHANERSYPFAPIHNGREYPVFVKGAKGSPIVINASQVRPDGTGVADLVVVTPTITHSYLVVR